GCPGGAAHRAAGRVSPPSPSSRPPGQGGSVPSTAPHAPAPGRPSRLRRPRPGEPGAMVDPSYRAFLTAGLEEYLDRTAPIVDPMVFDRIHVRSLTGEEVNLSFVGLDITSRQFARARAAKNSRWIAEKIEAAVQVAKDAG